MKIRPRRKFLYRAVSDAELDDINQHGLRSKRGTYETVKLFALEYNDADLFGKINQAYDDLPFIVIKVSVPDHIFKGAFLFEADGMHAVSIEEKYLILLKVIS
jgi:hypothetical protein